VRARFSKLGRVRFTSHRDVARMWERALRRGRVPVLYTHGFSPRPQLSFGLALPTTCESVAEYLDVAVEGEDEAAVSGVAELGLLLPDGVEVLGAGAVKHGTPSLQEAVTSCAWEIAVPGMTPGDLDDAVATTLGASALPLQRDRKGRMVTDDVRPSLLALRAERRGEDAWLCAELATRPRGLRPAELAQVMGIELGLARRTCQWIERDGSRWEPLEADNVQAAGTWERAS
jgi:radical SAM-linked protein